MEKFNTIESENILETEPKTREAKLLEAQISVAEMFRKRWQEN